MQIKAVLSPNGDKNLSDTINNIIDVLNFDVIKKVVFKAALGTFGIFGDDGRNTLYYWIRGLFENVVKSYFDKFHIYAKVKELIITQNGEELKASITLEEIDYAKSLTHNSQTIINWLKKKAPENVAIKILDVLGKDRNAAVSKLLKSIDDQKKERIIKLLITEFQSKLCLSLTKCFSEYKIPLDFKEISLK